VAAAARTARPETANRLDLEQAQVVGRPNVRPLGGVNTALPNRTVRPAIEGRLPLEPWLGPIESIKGAEVPMGGPNRRSRIEPAAGEPARRRRADSLGPI